MTQKEQNDFYKFEYLPTNDTIVKFTSNNLDLFFKNRTW